jgi:hypothetical protein
MIEEGTLVRDNVYMTWDLKSGLVKIAWGNYEIIVSGESKIYQALDTVKTGWFVITKHYKVKLPIRVGDVLFSYLTLVKRHENHNEYKINFKELR